MEAQLSMTGWVGGEVEFRHTQTTGTSRASFRLACTPRVRRQGTWTDDPTTWMTVICWRALAEHVASSLGKGEPVLVLGRLRTQAWDDDQGQKRERQVLDATSIGHDLSKGTAAFRRAKRQQPPADEPEDGTAATASEHHIDEAGSEASRTDNSGRNGPGTAPPHADASSAPEQPGEESSAAPATAPVGV